jgi:hypothetical protein
MQPPNLQRSNASKRNTWNAPGPSAAKTITSAAEAREVALLCGHHLDRLRVLAIASVVRLNDETISIRPRSEHKMKRSTRQSHWEGSLSVYAHHHAACLDDGVRGFAGGELQFFGGLVRDGSSDRLSANVDADVRRRSKEGGRRRAICPKLLRQMSVFLLDAASSVWEGNCPR